MAQHDDLPPMMRLMRKHVREHGGPPAGHTGTQLPRENFGTRRRGSGWTKHPSTFAGTAAHSSYAPPPLASKVSTVQDPAQLRTLQKRQPNSSATPAGSCANAQRWPQSSALPPSCARQLRPPRPRVEMRQQQLVHRVVDGISLEQNRRDLTRRKITHFVYR